MRFRQRQLRKRDVTTLRILVYQLLISALGLGELVQSPQHHADPAAGGTQFTHRDGDHAHKRATKLDRQRQR